MFFLFFFLYIYIVCVSDVFLCGVVVVVVDSFDGLLDARSIDRYGYGLLFAIEV